MCISGLSYSEYKQPRRHQGKTLGVFRSLGALARVVGPIGACLIYWQWGSSAPYYLGAAFLIFPILMVMKLPKLETA